MFLLSGVETAEIKFYITVNNYAFNYIKIENCYF